MIKIYKTSNSVKRMKQIIEWMNSYNLEYKVISTTELSDEILKEILAVSERGLYDIILSRNNSSIVHKIELDKYNIEDMTVNEVIKFILKNPDLLKGPIIFDEKKLLVGYNSTEIRKFIPKY